MDITVAQLAAIISTTLAPFTPYLVESGKKFAEEVGKDSWVQAKAIWNKIKLRWEDDKAIEGAAMMLSSEPENEAWQTQFAKVIVKKLEKDINFAEELLVFLGGKKAVQKVIATNASWIENVTQEIESSNGQQIVKADDSSVISVVKQSIKKSTS